MSSTLVDPDAGISSLPQCGFGTDTDFDSLIKSNRFLFRVYTPKERSPFADDTDPFFVAPRFDELVARSPIDVPDIKLSESAVGTYADVARHMEWTTRTSSTYISTSFSFTWAIWEAVRRYYIGVKKDVEIAIIDATALRFRAATAVQLLKKSSPEERNEQFWKWHRFSQDSQSVLVYGMIPRTAVLASIPLLQILRKMPSYFLNKDVQIIDGNPLDQVAWDYTKRKHNYRQFCHDMTSVFMGRSVDVRLRDSTAGAVRLALSFLRPYVHTMVQDNFEVAVSYLRNLATTISDWPGSWWIRDHPEVRKIVEVMVLAVAEELRANDVQNKGEEVLRLQVVIDGLEQTIKAQQATPHAPQYFANHVELDSDGEFELELDGSQENTLVNPLESTSSTSGKPLLHMSVAVIPRIPISFQSPITPPESPRTSLFIPTAAVPLSDIILANRSPLAQQSFKEEDLQLVHVTTASPTSDEPASPPPTPPANFSPVKLPTIAEDDLDTDLDELHNDDSGRDDANDVNPLMEEVKESNFNSTAPSVESVNGQAPQGRLEELDESSACQAGEEPRSDEAPCELESEQGRFPPMVLAPSWMSIRQLESPYSSRRSSIMSMDTLCDPVEFPMKRVSMSFATMLSDSFELAPTARSVGYSSRTTSFSEFSPRIQTFTPPLVDPLAVPLPSSPAQSEVSILPSRSVSRSRSSSSASTSSTSSSALSSDLIAPLITPLPPSPAWSLVSLSSSISRSTSSDLSSPITPVATAAEALPLPPGTIIPPKARISLLSPLPEQEIDDEHVGHKHRIRSGAVSETASYIVTGFLVGAFITIFLFSTQRRTMLYVT